MLLKGLFVQIKKKALLHKVLFGFSKNKDFNSIFKKQFLHLPTKLMKNGTSVIEGMISNAQPDQDSIYLFH